MVKKILACVVAVVMCMSLVNVAAFADDGSQLPQCISSEITGDALQITDDFKLDFGMTFATEDEIEDLIGNPIADWLVDFEITFSKDTTAILAGQYDKFDENWVIGNFEDEKLGLTKLGYEFKAGETVKIMETFFKPIWEENNENVNFVYSDVVSSVKEFNCGVKVTGDEDLDITLKLCLYEATQGELDENGHFEYITNGVVHDAFYQNYEYESLTTLLGKTDSDEKKVGLINDMAGSYNAETVADVVLTLSEEAKAAIKPSTIEKIAEAVDTTGSSVADAEVSTIAGTNDNLVITIEEADDAEHAALAGGIVYDIDATVGGVDKYVLDAPVRIKIPVADPDSIDEVRHCHDGVIESIPFEKGSNYIAFTAVKFSQYALITNAQPVAGNAVLEFVPNDVDPEDGILTYDLVLRGTDNDVVRGFTAGEFTVAVSDAQARWAITPVNKDTNIKLESTNGNERKYLVNLKSFDKNNSWTVNPTDGKLKLGTLTVEGYGVEGYIAFGDEILMSKHDYTVTEENLTVAIETAPGNSAYFNIPVPTRKATINVYANHKVINQNWNYQDMTVTISGVDLAEDIVFNLGASSTDVNFANDVYTVEADLVLNRDYTVKVEGAGYRTAEYNFTATEDKTINFWNNAKDYEEAMEVYGTINAGLAKVNFLAGDIVEDNIINIYDLSAVVSYFDEKVTDFTVKNSLAQYDLNRDGNINSRDISILLDSWNK